MQGVLSCALLWRRRSGSASLQNSIKVSPPTLAQNSDWISDFAFADQRGNRRRFGWMTIHCLRVLRPDKGKMDDLTGFLNINQGLQRCANHLQLSFAIAWASQRQTKRVFQRGDTRKPIGTAVIRDHVDTNGRDACIFNHTLHQSDGPATDRSHRHKESDIDVLGRHDSGYVRG